MRPSYVDSTGEYYFLHTLLGDYPKQHFDVLKSEIGHWDRRWSYLKIRNFLNGPDDKQEMEKYLGLPWREIMTTLSTVRNAVTYHLPFGLVMDGNIQACYNNDSGLPLSEKGTYEGEHFRFTEKVNIEYLVSHYAEKYKMVKQSFVWDEIVLAKGSKICGAFHDPRASSDRRRQARYDTPENEYDDFIKKCETLGLPLLEIDAKWK